MKKIIALIFSMCFLLAGCQAVTKEYGGTTKITLEPNVKLEEITWKDDDLWYMTRPMREDEEAETHYFSQSSNWHVFEGEVIIIEQKGE